MARSSKKSKVKKSLAKKSSKKATKKVVKRTKKVVRVPVKKQEKVQEFDFSKAEKVGDRFKGKQIVLAPQDKVEELSHYIALILEAIGHSEALVTDESTIYDFSLEQDEMERAIEELEMEFTTDDYLIDIAEKMHNRDVEVEDVKDAKKDEDIPAEHEYKDEVDDGSKNTDGADEED
jgi:hypothetical protein